MKLQYVTVMGKFFVKTLSFIGIVVALAISAGVVNAGIIYDQTENTL